MYYAASVNEVKRDGSLSVTYRDLRKTAIVPRDWILPRDKTDMRSVIPNEVATSRTSSEGTYLAIVSSGLALPMPLRSLHAPL